MKKVIVYPSLLLSAVLVAACSTSQPPYSVTQTRMEASAKDMLSQSQPMQKGIASVQSLYQPLPVIPEQREKYASIENNKFINPSIEPLSTISTDVDSASFSNARRFIARGDRVPVDAVRSEEFINYFDYQYPAPAKGEVLRLDYELAQTPWNKHSSLLRVSLQAEKMITDKGKNLIFLIDVSGSMSSADKLPLLKRSLKMLVDNLSVEDRVSLVSYAGFANTVIQGEKGNNKRVINNAIDQLQAGGSTNGEDGLALAYEIAARNFIEGGANKIFIATDGDFNLGMQDPAQMEQYIAGKRDSAIALNVIGVGSGNYNDQLMEQISNVGNGAAIYIDSLLQAQKALIDQVDSLLSTIAYDAKFQIEFNPQVVDRYRLIGYENRQLNTQDFNDDKKDAADIGAGQSVTALYEVILKGSDHMPKLRYQTASTAELEVTTELALIKTRYKKTRTAKSNHHSRVVKLSENKQSSKLASHNFRLAAAAAAYGQKLRLQAELDNFTWPALIALAKSAKGIDRQGYRSAFIQQLRLSQSIYQ